MTEQTKAKDPVLRSPCPVRCAAMVMMGLAGNYLKPVKQRRHVERGEMFTTVTRRPGRVTPAGGGDDQARSGLRSALALNPSLSVPRKPSATMADQQKWLAGG